MSILKPKIYISSTVYDFRDLRSVLKYWLEQLGFDVMLSEFNDFTKPLDQNSYNACLHAVEQSNYFILLIGTRVGGLYNKAEKISITRMEYRKAYELVTTGKMKVITFVRGDIWNVKEDRKALAEYLIEDFIKRKELGEEDIKAIAKHPSTIVNDAESTFDFLYEVGKVDEMKKAIDGKGDFPPANWVHPFNTFQEIIETLQIEFGISKNLNTIALTTNLKRELLSNLAKLSSKNGDNKVDTDLGWAKFSRAHLRGDLNDTSEFHSQYIRWLVMYLAVSIIRDMHLSNQFIDQALTTGSFLEYDFKTNSYEIGSIHNALFTLKENINRLGNMMNDHFQNNIRNFVNNYCPKNNPRVKRDNVKIKIANTELIAPFALYDCQHNIIEHCIAILKALDGDNEKILSLKVKPPMPLAEEAEQIAKETPTIEDVSNWLESL